MEKEVNIKMISNLIMKMIRQEITKEEEIILIQWLGESEERQKLFGRLRNEQYMLEQYHQRQNINVDKAWGKITSSPKKHVLRFVSYAAAIILLIGSTLTYLLLSEKKNLVHTITPIASNNILPGTGKATLIISDKQEIQLDKEQHISMTDSTGAKYQNDSSTLYYNAGKLTSPDSQAENTHTLVIRRGGEYNVILADGTKVYLNSDSKLRYPTAFTQSERRVYLEGEAYFEVSHDKEHPFIVEGKGFAVKVLGTSFNVSNYKDDDISRVVLLEGSVMVRKAEKNYKLTPNQALEIDGDEVSVKEVNAANAISWKNDKFYFSNERLEIVMMKLARWYDVNLFYANQTVKDYHFTGFIPKYADISKAFTILELTTDVKFELKDRNVTIKRRE